MDGAIVIAALILNPLARRKRAAEVSELVQLEEAPTALSDGSEGSNPLEKSDLESGSRPIADKSVA